MAGNIQTIRNNSQPQGGMAAQQPVQPMGNLTPAEIAALVESLTPIQARFRASSTFLNVGQNQVSWGTTLGTTQSLQITNVGLGVMLLTEWNVVIQVTNAATSAESFFVSQYFPYNLVANTAVQINGGATSYSCSGIGTLSVMSRQRMGSLKFTALQSQWNAALGLSLDPSLIQTNTLGSNFTATNSTNILPKFSGVTQVSVAGSAAAGANSRWTVRFVTVEKLAFDRDSLLGVLPLQNNSTFVQVNRTLASALSGTRKDLTIPFYTAGADLTFSLISATADTTYVLASVPPNPALYQNMVANSFQVQEQQNNIVNSTGVEALVYNIPQNLLLAAAHIIAVDTNGVPVLAYDSTNGFGDSKIAYNAKSVIPILQKVYRQRAQDYLFHDYDPMSFPGRRLIDLEDSCDNVNQSDDMQWLDTYSTAAPQILTDVGTSASTNLTYSLVRESIVAGAVQQVGG